MQKVLLNKIATERILRVMTSASVVSGAARTSASPIFSGQVGASITTTKTTTVIAGVIFTAATKALKGLIRPLRALQGT